MGRYTGSPTRLFVTNVLTSGVSLLAALLPEHPASLMENTQCGDERQIGSNCLSSATARHPSDGSHPTPTAL